MRTGLVHNVARPERNLTGFSNYIASIFQKQFDIFHQGAPTANQIGVIYNPDTVEASLVRNGRDDLDFVRAAAVERGSQVEELKVRSVSDIKDQVSSFIRKTNSALFVMSDAFTTSNLSIIIEVANKLDLANMYPHPYFVTEGGLMSFGIDTFNLYFEAAEYVDRILNAATIAELPVRYPDKFIFVVNQKTAQSLNVVLPQSLTISADQVIE